MAKTDTITCEGDAKTETDKRKPEPTIKHSMNTKETRIEFVNLTFTGYIAESCILDDLTKKVAYQLILSMSWAWRAPDKNDFNCAYIFPLAAVARNALYEQEFIIRPSDQLCIRTMAQGKSTIKFSLICTDISNDNSPIKKAFDKMGKVIIGKSSRGEVPSITLMDGARTFANYNLERIVESTSDKESPDLILGRAHLDFDSETTKTKEEKLISMKTDDGGELLKLCINVIRA